MPFITKRSDNLWHHGPTVDLIFVPPKSIADQLKKEGKPIPMIKAIALIDTGASHTCISSNIVNGLSLLPYDVQEVHTAGGRVQQLIYDIGIITQISGNIILSTQAPCATMDEQPYQALLGRDILRHCSLHYNGADNSFSLYF